mmetsp:Transcript_65505/g.109948  ORF Transcript_65505/g.109948 Transcript_65505/m.109948 type:complete len:85 (+) Transcript_65505:1061-1315(+)
MSFAPSLMPSLAVPEAWPVASALAWPVDIVLAWPVASVVTWPALAWPVGIALAWPVERGEFSPHSHIALLVWRAGNLHRASSTT